MKRHVRGLLAALLALVTAMFLAPSARAQDSDFCGLIERGRMSVQVSETGSGVVITLSAISAVDLVHEQAQILADRASTGLVEGSAPAPGLGEWSIQVPPASVIVSQRVSGSVLIMTGTTEVQIEDLKFWGARIVRLLEEGRCDDLLAPVGEV